MRKGNREEVPTHSLTAEILENQIQLSMSLKGIAEVHDERMLNEMHGRKNGSYMVLISPSIV